MANHTEREIKINKVIKYLLILSTFELIIYLLVVPQTFNGIPGLEEVFKWLNNMFVPPAHGGGTIFQVLIGRLLHLIYSIPLVKALLPVLIRLIPIALGIMVFVVKPFHKMIKNKSAKKALTNFSKRLKSNTSWAFSNTLSPLEKRCLRRNLKKLQNDTVFNLFPANSTCIRLQMLSPDTSDIVYDTVWEWSPNNTIEFKMLSGKPPFEVYLNNGEAYIRRKNSHKLTLNQPFFVGTNHGNFIITWIGEESVC